MNEGSTQRKRELYLEIKRDIPAEYHAGIFDVLRVVPAAVQRDAYERMKREIESKQVKR